MSQLSMKNAEVFSHWAFLADEFQTSSLDFYKSVEEALAAREIPDIELSRVEWAEGGMASAKRQYLRVRRGKLVFDICAAPFGRGFFFSWWLARMGQRYGALWAFGLVFAGGMVLSSVWGQSRTFGGFFVGLFMIPVLLWVLLAGLGSDPATEDAILETPYIGWLYRKLFNPHTYYKIDTATMFQESVRRAVNEVIGELRNAQGLRALSEAELRPRLRDLSEL